MSAENQNGSVVTTQGQAVTVKQTNKQIVEGMTSQVVLIQAAIAEVMKEGVHYGTIPGCANKSLYKPGAEYLLLLFRLGVDPSVEREDDGDSVTYRIKTRLFHIDTGATIGFGLGECSTLEDKYNWRGAVCDEEFSATDDNRKRIKWSKGKDGKGYQTKQVRTNYKDLANTVLKMAKKRSLVDAVLTCTAASDCFTQDLEDYPEYAAMLANTGKDTKAHQNNTPPKSTSAAANASTDEEASALKAHGLWIVTKDGEDIVEGNTYQKGDFIKPFGFKWDGDAKKWKRPAKAKATAPQSTSEKHAKTETKQTSMTLEEIDNAIAEIGGILSEPTPTKKGDMVLVQATEMDVDDAVAKRLGELGFTLQAGKWIKDVTSLVTAEANSLFQ